jgi:tetratricopeptide (TPR) repeat protein
MSEEIRTVCMPLPEVDILLAEMKSLMDSARYAEAIRVGQALLTKVPTSVHNYRALIYYNLGTCSNELGQYAEAEERYALSIQENPNDSDTWYNRANNYNRWGGSAYRSGDIAGSRAYWKRAMEYAQRAQQLNPTDPDILHLLTQITSNLNL